MILAARLWPSSLNAEIILSRRPGFNRAAAKQRRANRRSRAGFSEFSEFAARLPVKCCSFFPFFCLYSRL
jgi:hypothetical protein